MHSDEKPPVSVPLIIREYLKVRGRAIGATFPARFATFAAKVLPLVVGLCAATVAGSVAAILFGGIRSLTPALVAGAAAAIMVLFLFGISADFIVAALSAWLNVERRTAAVSPANEAALHALSLRPADEIEKEYDHAQRRLALYRTIVWAPHTIITAGFVSGRIPFELASLAMLASTANLMLFEEVLGTLYIGVCALLYREIVTLDLLRQARRRRRQSGSLTSS